jgi:hypothetical protein
MPREGETPEAQKWDQVTDKPHTGGKGRRAVDPDGVPEIMGGGPSRTFCPFELSVRMKKELGINDETHTYTYVRNPGIYEEVDGVNRVDETKDQYDGAEVVFRPDSHDYVRRSDTILMKIPIEHMRKREEDQVNRCLDAYAMNPAAAIHNGMPYEKVMENIEKRGSESLIALRGEQFEFGDGNKAKWLAARAREANAPRRNLQGSATYGQSYERAYDNQIAEIQIQNPRMTWAAAEAEHGKAVDHMEERAMMGASMDSGADNWAADVDRSAKRSSGMYSIGADFGPRTEDVIRNRHGRNKAQGGR